MSFDWVADIGTEYADISVFADKHKIAQAVRNFLSNAIKFSKPGGAVSMHMKILELEVSNRRHLSSTVSKSDWPEASVLIDDVDREPHVLRFTTPPVVDGSGDIASIDESSGGSMDGPPAPGKHRQCYCRVEVHDSGPGLSKVC
jgi:signal transduction histidine kinase